MPLRGGMTLLVPAVVALVTTGALVAVATLGDGWPGQAGASAWMFCERFAPGLVAQPANTFSNAGFVLVGLAVGWTASRDLAVPDRAPRNRMTRPPQRVVEACMAALPGPRNAATPA